MAEPIFVLMENKEANAKTVVVQVFANMDDWKLTAEIVAEPVFVLMENKEVYAKIAVAQVFVLTAG